MQTFSSMRRNSTDQNRIAFFFVSAFLLIAQILSSLYPWIPSLAGFFFAYALLSIKQEVRKVSLFIVFVYLSVYDVHQGFYLFSYLFLFIIASELGIYRVEQMTSCQKCILLFYVSVGYLGHYALNFLLSYIANTPPPYFASHYFYLIGFDTLLAFVFLKVRR